jgi:uncharacterized protein
MMDSQRPLTPAGLNSAASTRAGLDRPDRTRQRWVSVALVLIAGLSLPGPALAQDKLLRTLTVSGRGVETIPTTLTQVRLGVEAQGKTANQVQTEVARRSDAVVKLLKARGVDKLQTTGISLNPIYSYTDNKQVLTGYGASNMVSFRLPTSQAGVLLDDAVQAGASRIDGVSFVATDEAIAAAQKAALRKATQDAQAQANAVLAALNFSAKEIVSIQVNGASAPPPRPMALMQRSAAADTATPVIGGDQEVDGSVTLQISY